MMTESTLPEDPAPPPAAHAARSSARRPGARRRTILAASAIVIAVAVIATASFLRPWERAEALPTPTPTPTATPTPTSTPFATPGPQTPVALASTPGVSDVFDDWRARTLTPEVTMLASDDVHDGAYSLRVLSSAGGGEIAAQYESVAFLTPGTFYTASAWIKSEGTARGAVEFRPGTGWDDVIAVPGGSYDWQQVSVRFQAQGLGATFRIVVEGSTDGLLIDGVSYVADDGTVAVFGNGSFEANSADLNITNPSLILLDGQAAISLSTRRAPDGWLTWSAVDDTGRQAASGAEHFSGTAATVPLDQLDPGFYTLAIQARIGGKIVERSTTLGIVESIPYSGVLADSPYGIHLHYSDSRERDAATVGTLAALGIGHVRADAVWHKTELEPGQYAQPADTAGAMQALAAHGMSALQVPVYVNPLYDDGRTPSTSEGLTAYGAFTADLLATFPNVGQDVEVYNEFDHFFNTGTCGPTPQCYMPMLDAVNAAAPNATVVGPSLSGMGFKWDWLQQFFDQGGLDRIDVVTAHPYTQPEPASDFGDDIDRLREMMENAGGAKPIWITEMGWAAVGGWVSDEEQAAYLVQTMAASFGHGAERVYWYEAVDQRSNPADIEGNFGMLESSTALAPLANAPKRSAVAQSVVAQMLEDAEPDGQDEVKGAESYRFTKAGQDLRVMWAPDGDTTAELATKKDVVVTDIYGTSTTLSPKAGKVIIELGIDPVYVEGSVAVKAAKGD